MITINSHRKKGRYLSSNVDIASGTVIISATTTKIQSHRDMYSLQLNNQHIIMDKPAIYVNHSCEANCTVKPNNKGAFDFISKQTIFAGEEICFDYTEHEDEIAAPFFCLCSSQRCKGYVFKQQQVVKMNVNKMTITVSVQNAAKILAIEWEKEKLPTEYPIEWLINTNSEKRLEQQKISGNQPHIDSSIHGIEISDKLLNLRLSNGKQFNVTFDELANYREMKKN